MSIKTFRRFFRRLLNRTISILGIRPTLTITRLRRLTRRPRRRKNIPLPHTSLFKRRTSRPPLLNVRLSNVRRPTMSSTNIRQTNCMVQGTRLVNTTSKFLTILAKSRSSQRVLSNIITIRRIRRLGPIRLKRRGIRRRRHSVTRILLRLFRTLLTIHHFRSTMVPTRSLQRSNTIRHKVIRSRSLQLFLPTTQHVLLRRLTKSSSTILPSLNLVRRPINLPSRNVRTIT